MGSSALNSTAKRSQKYSHPVPSQKYTLHMFTHFNFINISPSRNEDTVLRFSETKLQGRKAPKFIKQTLHKLT